VVTLSVWKGRFLHAGTLSPDPKWYMAAHSHDFHEMITIVGGKMHIAGVGLDKDCLEGDVLLYPAGVAHAEYSNPADPLQSVFMTFRCPEVRLQQLRCTHDRRGRMREMVRWLYEDRLSNDPAREVARDALCTAALAEFFGESVPESDPLVERTRAWVLERITEPITLEDLARRESLSRFHFIRRYKAATGRTPMEDVRAIRLDHARGLLLGTSLTLKQIAPLAGLGDEYCLSRAFRRALGASPSSFRRFHGGRSRG
jgi:AraC-like DNA-binding protein